MQVTILVEGENDIKPFTKTFQYEKSSEFIFFDSIEVIKNKLSNKMRLNINETLALFTACVITMLQEKKSIREIQELSSQILLPHQVLIGVPELLRKLTFSVTIDDFLNEVITIACPIPSASYFLNETDQAVR